MCKHICSNWIINNVFLWVHLYRSQTHNLKILYSTFYIECYISAIGRRPKTYKYAQTY